VRLEAGPTRLDAARLAATPRSGSRGRTCRSRRRRRLGVGDRRHGSGNLDPRQADRERRPTAGLRGDRDLATGPRGEAADHREAQPGALVGRLRREERLENLVDDLGRDPRSGVADVDLDDGPRSVPAAPPPAVAAAASAARMPIVIVPPSGIASRALTARLMRACSSWPLSRQATIGPSGSSSSTSIWPPRSCRSSGASSTTTSPTSTGSLGLLVSRATASRRRVSSRAFSTTSTIAAASVATWVSFVSALISSAKPPATVSVLLKSWARPLARRPIASIFWAWSSWASS
jgi:hypothetical protein